VASPIEKIQITETVLSLDAFGQKARSSAGNISLSKIESFNLNLNLPKRYFYENF